MVKRAELELGAPGVTDEGWLGDDFEGPQARQAEGQVDSRAGRLKVDGPRKHAFVAGSPAPGQEPAAATVDDTHPPLAAWVDRRSLAVQP